MTRTAVEEDDAIATRAAGVARGIFFARPFHENFHLLADEGIVFARSDFVDEVEQAMIAFLADFLRHLVGHVGGGRVAARRVFENVGVVELHFAAERQRLLEVFFSLAGKADDDVRRDTDTRFGGAQLRDDAEKFFARVATVHELEQTVAAALQRNVRALAQFRQPRIGFDQVVAVTFRMRRGEADTFQSFDRVHGVEQLDESGFAIEQGIIALAEARDNLTEQGDFANAARDEFAAFGDDVINRATAFFAAC